MESIRESLIERSCAQANRLTSPGTAALRGSIPLAQAVRPFLIAVGTGQLAVCAPADPYTAVPPPPFHWVAARPVVFRVRRRRVDAAARSRCFVLLYENRGRRPGVPSAYWQWPAVSFDVLLGGQAAAALLTRCCTRAFAAARRRRKLARTPPVSPYASYASCSGQDSPYAIYGWTVCSRFQARLSDVVVLREDVRQWVFGPAASAVRRRRKLSRTRLAFLHVGWRARDASCDLYDWPTRKKFLTGLALIISTHEFVLRLVYDQGAFAQRRTSPPTRRETLP